MSVQQQLYRWHTAAVMYEAVLEQHQKRRESRTPFVEHRFFVFCQTGTWNSALVVRNSNDGENQYDSSIKFLHDRYTLSLVHRAECLQFRKTLSEEEDKEDKLHGPELADKVTRRHRLVAAEGCDLRR